VQAGHGCRECSFQVGSPGAAAGGQGISCAEARPRAATLFESIDAAAHRRGIEFAEINQDARDIFILHTMLLGPHLEVQADAILGRAQAWPADVVVWGDGTYAAALAADRLARPLLLLPRCKQ
jgi:hypothetical protein